jgi:hypothetical protein
MPRRSRALGLLAQAAAPRYPFPWHKHRELSPGIWTVIGDMSLTKGEPLESCELAGCSGPKEGWRPPGSAGAHEASRT